MRHLLYAVWGLAVLVGLSVSEGADQQPVAPLDSLKKEQDAALEELESRRKPGTTEADQKKALDRFYETAAEMIERLVAEAETASKR